MIKLTTVSASTVLPLTLEECKDHLRLDCEDEDAILLGYLRAETENVEQILNRALVTQTLDLYLDGFPSEAEIPLPRPPLQSVTGVNYTVSGATGDYGSTFAAANYAVDTNSTPARVSLKANKVWPSATLETTNPVRVRFVAGYGDIGSDVPEAIRTAILLRVGDRYWQRENTGDGRLRGTRAAERLLAPFKVW